MRQSIRRLPLVRSDCVDGPRPCPFVSCRHHLYADVVPETGRLRISFPKRRLEQLHETCSLDVADRGGMTLEEVGELVGLTRERIRQLEEMALQHIRAGGVLLADDALDDQPTPGGGLLSCDDEAVTG